jgi:adenylyltransferase/sulfurtransferase
VKEITVHEFEELRINGRPYQLIDVREPFEYDIVNLSGELIPLNKILTAPEKISTDKKVIIHCKSGGRSAEAIKNLEEQFGFDNLFNLKGGILQYIDDVQPNLKKY